MNEQWLLRMHSDDARQVGARTQVRKSVEIQIVIEIPRLVRLEKEGGKDSGKKHTDRRIKPRLVIMKAPGAVPMAPAFGWD